MAKRSDYVKVSVPRSSSYAELCRHASDTLEMAVNVDAELRLFRVDGTMVLNRPIDGKDWTVQRYLDMCNRSAAQLKLGVGYWDKEVYK